MGQRAGQSRLHRIRPQTPVAELAARQGGARARCSTALATTAAPRDLISRAVRDTRLPSLVLQRHGAPLSAVYLDLRSRSERYRLAASPAGLSKRTAPFATGALAESSTRYLNAKRTHTQTHTHKHTHTTRTQHTHVLPLTRQRMEYSRAGTILPHHFALLRGIGFVFDSEVCPGSLGFRV
jgi:hypothetical protein